jgi:hypothetical protein
MRLWKIGLRIWIAVGSVLSFVTGWALFGHSPKPVELTSLYVAPMPTLEPLPPMGQGSVDDFQPRQPFALEQPSFPMFGPRFTTGGS